MSTSTSAAARDVGRTGPTRRAGRPRRSSGPAGRWPFAVPGLVLLGGLSLYPIVVLVTMALHEVTTGTLNQPWPFVGLGNVRELVAGPDLGPSLWRTLVFVAVVTVVGVVGGLGAALVVRGSRRTSAVLLAVMVFVWALPPVVNGSVWKFLLAEAGLVNDLVRALGLPSVPFLFDPDVALLSVALVNSWAVVPFNALVFRAALLSIDPEVLEAAAVDGASRWQEVRHVLVPSARPTALVLTVLTVVYALRSFDFIYVMTAGGPGTSTTTLPFLSYVEAFVRQDFGTGSAAGVLALVVVGGLALVYVRTARGEQS